MFFIQLIIDNLEDFEVESMINSVMMNEFNVVSEDADDALLVAKEICRFYSLWKGNKHEILRNKLRQLPMVDLSECQAAYEQPVSFYFQSLGILNLYQTEKSKRGRKNPCSDED